MVAVVENTLPLPPPATGMLVHVPDAPDLWAQVDWAIDHEWATTVEDVLRRRTSLALRGLASYGIDSEVERFIDVVQRIGVQPFKEQVYGKADQRPPRSRRDAAVA